MNKQCLGLGNKFVLLLALLLFPALNAVGTVFVQPRETVEIPVPIKNADDSADTINAVQVTITGSADFLANVTAAATDSIPKGTAKILIPKFIINSGARDGNYSVSVKTIVNDVGIDPNPATLTASVDFTIDRRSPYVYFPGEYPRFGENAPKVMITGEQTSIYITDDPKGLCRNSASPCKKVSGLKRAVLWRQVEGAWDVVFDNSWNNNTLEADQANVQIGAGEHLLSVEDWAGNKTIVSISVSSLAELEVSTADSHVNIDRDAGTFSGMIHLKAKSGSGIVKLALVNSELTSLNVKEFSGSEIKGVQETDLPFGGNIEDYNLRPNNFAVGFGDSSGRIVWKSLNLTFGKQHDYQNQSAYGKTSDFSTPVLDLVEANEAMLPGAVMSVYSPTKQEQEAGSRWFWESRNGFYGVKNVPDCPDGQDCRTPINLPLREFGPQEVGYVRVRTYTWDNPDGSDMDEGVPLVNRYIFLGDKNNYTCGDQSGYEENHGAACYSDSVPQNQVVHLKRYVQTSVEMEKVTPTGAYLTACAFTSPGSGPMICDGFYDFTPLVLAAGPDIYGFKVRMGGVNSAYGVMLPSGHNIDLSLFDGISVNFGADTVFSPGILRYGYSSVENYPGYINLSGNTAYKLDTEARFDHAKITLPYNAEGLSPAQEAGIQVFRITDDGKYVMAGAMVDTSAKTVTSGEMDTFGQIMVAAPRYTDPRTVVSQATTAGRPELEFTAEGISVEQTAYGRNTPEAVQMLSVLGPDDLPVGNIYKLGPEELSLDTPGVLKMHFDPSMPGSENVESLAVYRAELDGSGMQELADSVVDPINHEVAVEVSRPSGLFLLVARMGAAPADTTPPSMLLSYDGAAYDTDGKKYISAETKVAISGTDEGSGMGDSYYSVDANPVIGNVAKYPGPFTLESGVRTLYYYGVDLAGNVSSPYSALLYVDAQAPVTALSISGNQYADNSHANIKLGDLITIQAADNDVASGLKEIYVLVDTPPADCDGPTPPAVCENAVYTGPFSLPMGAHTVYYSAADNVGNRAVVRTAHFLVGGEVNGSYNGQTEMVLNTPLAAAAVELRNEADADVALALSEAAGQKLVKVSHIYNVTPEQVYPQPTSITFYYDPAALAAGVQESDLSIYEHVGTQWVALGGLVRDSVNHKLTAPVAEVHSLFAVFAPEPTAPETGVFVRTGDIGLGRYAYTATTLDNGKVLIAGGQSGVQGDVARADLYDPATGSFSQTGSMNEAREGHVAVKLQNGKVLVVGGVDAAIFRASAELYDPATGVFTQVGSMSVGRYGHTATLLADGQVLVTGGSSDSGPANTAELYDPETGTFRTTGSMSLARAGAGAVRLADGRVLITGGNTSMHGGTTATAEIYDPATGEFSQTGSMLEGRYWVNAILLNSGKVLVAGGPTAGAELYDPAAGTFSATGPMSTSRLNGTAVKLDSGNVLMAGGSNGSDLATAEIYNVGSGSFGSLINMATVRGWPPGVKLLDGRVLVASGYGGGYLTLAELFVPEGWVATPAPVVTGVSPDSGEAGVQVTITGSNFGAQMAGVSAVTIGGVSAGIVSWSDTEIKVTVPAGLTAGVKELIVIGLSVQSSSAEFTMIVPQPVLETGAFLGTGGLSIGRYAYSATLLVNGKVLVAGGQAGSSYGDVNIAELYDPLAGTFSQTGSMNESREMQADTLLPNGKVLMVGGVTGGAVYNPHAELYDPASGAFSQTGSMSIGRYGHVQVLLPNGKVLVAGGRTTGNVDTASAEIYDPVTGTFSQTGSMNEARTSPGYVLLPNGKVLVMGGSTSSTILTSAEIYDPETGTFSYTGSMHDGRYWAKATLLDNGKVLVVGGTTAGAELYDPVEGTFSATGGMNSSHLTGAVVKLASGNVLVAGGVGNNSSAEIYNVAAGAFGSVPGMSVGRDWLTGVKLGDGRVLITGGYGTGYNASAELFVPDGWTPPAPPPVPSHPTAELAVQFTPDYSGVTPPVSSSEVEVRFTPDYTGVVPPVSSAELMVEFTPQDGYPLAAQDEAGVLTVTYQEAKKDGSAVAVTVVPVDDAAGDAVLALSNAATVGLSKVGSLYALGPDGTTFTPAAQVIFKYDESALNGTEESALNVYRYDTASGAWAQLPVVERNTEENWISVTVDHLCLFGIFYGGGVIVPTAEMVPSSGAIGVPFTISGSGFGTYSAATTKVLVGGVAAPLTLWNDTQINGTVPGALALGSHAVTVVRGTSTLADAGTFQVLAPQAAEVLPSSGAIGVPFTINGANFGNYVANYTRVLIGGTTAPLTLWTDTQIKGTVPGALAAGDYELVVERALNGGTSATQPIAFKVVAPELYAIIPTSGSIGVGFTLTGANFGNYVTNYTRVLIGGATAPLTLWTDGQIKGTVPGSLVSGTYDVTVERELNGGLVRSAAVQFTLVAPAVASVLPSSGAIGVPFTINGATFGNYVASYTKVLIGGTTCPLTLWTDTQIKGTVPGTLATGDYDLLVTRELNGGTITTQPVAFKVLAPEVAVVTPSSGAIGVPFTISGANFGNYVANYTKVLIGGTTCPLTLWTDTQIKGTVPGSLAAGSYELVIERSLNGGSVRSSTAAFLVTDMEIASVSPSSGPIGLPFTINGANFGNYVANYTKVLIGGTTCPLTLWTDTQIKGTVPGTLAAGDYELAVERALNGGVSRVTGSSFTVAAPYLTEVTPSTAAVLAPFTITGYNFGNYVANYTKVLIGGTTTALTLWTDTKIQGKLPFLPAGEYPVLVQRYLNGGLGESATAYISVAEPVLSSMTPVSGGVGTVFNLYGTGFGPYDASIAKVFIGGAQCTLSLWSDTQIRGTVPSALSFGTHTVTAVRGGVVSNALSYVIPNYTPSMFRIGTAQEFRLGDVYVYPDPAKGGKAPVFHIEVGTADTVKLRVYTVAGQLAHERTLTGEPQSIGGGYAYEYAWDGRIASGVYYYTVEAERSGKKLKARGKFAVVR